nr:MAG TPA: hypothetical protein [Bacteriophage sp.]
MQSVEWVVRTQTRPVQKVVRTQTTFNHLSASIMV